MPGKLMIGASAALLIAGGILLSGGSGGSGAALIAVGVVFLALGASRSKGIDDRAR